MVSLAWRAVAFRKTAAPLVAAVETRTSLVSNAILVVTSLNCAVSTSWEASYVIRGPLLSFRSSLQPPSGWRRCCRVEVVVEGASFRSGCGVGRGEALGEEGAGRNTFPLLSFRWSLGVSCSELHFSWELLEAVDPLLSRNDATTSAFNKCFYEAREERETNDGFPDK